MVQECDIEPLWCGVARMSPYVFFSTVGTGSFSIHVGCAQLRKRYHFCSWLPRLAAHQVWDGASDGSEEDEDDLGEGSKSETEDEMKRSGKLLVLQQILPLWHAQVGITGQKLHKLCVINPMLSLSR